VETPLGSIPRVSLFYVSQKARETNTLTHALQLKQTSLRSGLCARRQEDFKGRIWEHHCSHIATIGNEPRESRQFTLPQQERLTGFNMHRHLGRTAPPCLGSDYGSHITLPQPDSDTVATRLKLDIQGARHGSHCGSIVQWNRRLPTGQAQHTV
jgi:hypothetical protein